MSDPTVILPGIKGARIVQIAEGQFVYQFEPAELKSFAEEVWKAAVDTYKTEYAPKITAKGDTELDKVSSKIMTAMIQTLPEFKQFQIDVDWCKTKFADYWKERENDPL